MREVHVCAILMREVGSQELASEILEPGYGVCPLLANLAVGAATRGSGLGLELCHRVEDLAAEWGYGGIVLQVDSKTIVKHVSKKLGLECGMVDFRACLTTVFVFIQVEEGNLPAVKLYKSLGYQEIFVNEDWPALRPTTDGELATERVNLLALSKAL